MRQSKNQFLKEWPSGLLISCKASAASYPAASSSGLGALVIQKARTTCIIGVQPFIPAV